MSTAAIQGIPVARTSVDVRAQFIMKTYATLFVAIAAFAGVEVAIFQSGLSLPIAQLVGGSPFVMFGGFILVSWLGSRVAMTSQNVMATYAALAVFVLFESLFFVPLLYMADQVAPGAIGSAAQVTLAGFAGLTIVAFKSRKDFSFLGSLLAWGGIMALVLIVASMIFGFQLGVFFSVAMVAFSGAAILYDTSNILRHYPADRHAAAALQLFASVAMMFWYVLRIFISSRD